MSNKQKYLYQPDYSIHPGEYLQEVLSSRNITKRELSERLGISTKHLSQIINKKVLINASISLKLERTLGISASIWNNLNSDYALYQTKQIELKKNSEKLFWLKEFPIKDLMKYGFIERTKDPLKLIENLLEFFGIADIKSWDKFYKKMAVNFRKSSCFKDNIKHIISWLRAGEILASNKVSKKFDREIFKKNLNEIRNLTTIKPDNFKEKLENLCLSSGVILVFVPEFDQTHISGATKWLSQDTALIIMSLRYKTNDHFWFTFFHESAHILLHGKKQIFIDSNTEDDTIIEKEANHFAENFLIPKNKYLNFIRKNSFEKENIINFASEINIHPGIVVGRLQHDNYITYSQLNELKEKFEINFFNPTSSHRSHKT